MLIVLDNFENLLDGSEQVADILKKAPKIKIWYGEISARFLKQDLSLDENDLGTDESRPAQYTILQAAESFFLETMM